MNLSSKAYFSQFNQQIMFSKMWLTCEDLKLLQLVQQRERRNQKLS